VAEPPSLVLTVSAVGLAIGCCAGLGIVIGSRWPGAIERYDVAGAAFVVLKLAALGMVVALAALVVVAGLRRVRRSSSPAAATSAR
jgi:hypothetical protein